MSDLEADLLALADGAGSASESESDYDPTTTKRSISPDRLGRKKRKVVSDEEFDEDEDEDDYDPEAGLPSDDDDENEDLDFEEANPYPLEGKYKNQQDKIELDSMPEVERESILFERSQELQKYQERKLLAQRSKQNQKQTDRSSRSQKVKESAKSLKSSKLSELKKQREKKHRREQDDYASESEEEDPYDLEDEDEEDDGYEPDFQTYDSEVQWASRPVKKHVELPDINSIKTGRSVADKFCFYPGFKEAVTGTFGKVRVSQSEYRMVRIDSVVQGKPYRLNDKKVMTNQYFQLYQPGQPRKMFPMNRLSDDRITQQEFDKWKVYVDRAKSEGKSASMPTLNEVERKYEELKSFGKQKLEGEFFRRYLENRRRLNDSVAETDVLGAKLKLKQRLDIAQQRGDTQEVKRLTHELNEAEKKFSKISGSRVDSTSITAKISEKNRKLNNERVRTAELKNFEKRRTATHINSDPFARLTTRARMYYSEANKEETEKAKQDAAMEAVANADKEQEEKKLLQSAKYRTLGHLDKIIAGIDFKFDVEL
jgi:RNA polymerase-associated protein RTF1